MISRFKRINCRLFTSQSGNALPVVLIFAVAGLIIVGSFLYFHFSSSKISFSSLSTVQALLNARSGIYKGFYDLTNPESDSSIVLPLIDATASDFGESMFNNSDSLSDTADEVTKLKLDGGVVRYQLYKQSPVDTADVEAVSEGGSCIIRSVSRCRKSVSKVEATLGSRIPVHPDTVAICYNVNEWDAPGVKGTKIALSDSTADTISSWLKTLISKNQETLASSDTALDPPITIQSNRDISKIPRIVNGDLLLDGSFNTLVWKDTGTVIVIGRMDISTDVFIEGIRFIVGGEVTLSGKSRMNQTSIFSQSKIFFADNSRFSGNAMALNSIAIYGNASIENKSTIIVCGSHVSDTSSQKNKKIYSIEIGDKAIVDGVLLALGTPGDIKTHADVEITGVMIAQKEIGHLGKMAGFMAAGRFIDPEQSQDLTIITGKGGSTQVKEQKNIVRGDIEPLNTIDEYKLPFFIGKLTIVKWREY